MEPLLSVEGLEVSLFTRSGVLTAIGGLNFELAPGETLAIVGESGCGKSLTALALMGLLPSPPARLTAGSILMDGRNLARLPERELLQIRGQKLSMIFQDPMNSLNPVLSVGTQLVEAIRTHTDIGEQAAWVRARELLELVNIPNPQERLHEYPHRLSGGTCQRIMIAMAIACHPRVLIADEPTTALDVTIQEQILHLLRKLQIESGMGLIIITHDLGVVAEMADKVMVMYAGRKVEEAPVEALFDDPLHPYTQGLIGATPSVTQKRHEMLSDIPGMVPALNEMPLGCAFAPRCSRAWDRCRSERPAAFVPDEGRMVACFAVEIDRGQREAVA